MPLLAEHHLAPALSRWGVSGLAALTGEPDGATDASRACVVDRAQQVADEIAMRVRHLHGRSLRLSAAELLTGRAALLGLRRGGRISAGGATRLLRAQDGWLAMTLSRPDDAEMIPALVESPRQISDPWRAVAAEAAHHRADQLVARARLLDLPAAKLAEARPSAATLVRRGRPASAPKPFGDLLVADLSSMWAGPLCGKLLGDAGATVVKVETRSRPDGTRSGNPRFFGWMNAGKLCYEADLDSPELRRLLTVADVVIEGSRPGALDRRGLGSAQVPARAGQIWIRISGHGAGSRAIAFGDDAAVAGGLVGRVRGDPVFCGDAIADPLTGLQAARAVCAALSVGGGVLVDVSMAAVAAGYAALPLTPGDCGDVRPPVLPTEVGAAAALGADNDRVHLLISGRPC